MQDPINATTQTNHPPAHTRQVITRTASLGTEFNIEVEHLGDGTAKILTWKRKRKHDNKFTRNKEEEGAIYPLHQLLGQPNPNPDNNTPT